MVNNVNNLAANFWAVSGNSNGAEQPPTQNFRLPMPDENAATLVASAFRIPGGGFMSASVSKAEGFSPANPVMLVSGQDFEKTVNINDIDPQNASFIELLAFDGYSAAMGRTSQTARMAVRAVLMQELNGKEFAEFYPFTKMDFAGTLRGFMDSLHSSKNYEALMWVKSNVEQFFRHFNV